MTKALATLFADVALDGNISKLLTYAVPEHMLDDARRGARVQIRVRGHLRRATIIALKTECSLERVEPLEEISPQLFDLPKDLLELAEWISTYYHTPLSRTLDVILPAHIKQEKAPQKQLWIARAKSKEELAAACAKLRAKAPAQARLIDVMLGATKGLFVTELLETSGSSKSSLDSLIEAGLLTQTAVDKERCPLESAEVFPSSPKKLSDEQARALEQISFDAFKPYLLHGVTGSGKTEVYLQAIEKVLSAGKSVIVLVPEIALTHQSAERFHSRLPGKIALTHHRLSSGERIDQFRRIASGERPVVLGPRSAIYSPLPNLGLVIVDEEHDGSYKSSEMPAVHARDVAIMRAKISNCPVILGSATPSLESFSNAKSGKYHLLSLTKKAVAKTPPKIHIVDMALEFAKEKKYVLFSEPLITAIKKRLERSEQIILFLNRRGYHSHLLCMSCGESIHCPACSVTLTFHKGESKLACHLCGYEQKVPRQCPSCGSDEQLKFKGVGTELVESTLRAMMPNIRTLRMDADTTRTKKGHAEILRAFRSGKADVLIGTQMIAKGLDIPAVTLAAVLSCDMSLQLPDFRASEQTFQLIAQVAGRSGRGRQEGEVILQTHLPKHPVIQAAASDDYIRFYEEEITSRECFGFPPFSKMARLLFRGKDEAAVWRAATEAFTAAQQALPSSYTLHPVSAPGYAKIGEVFRVQFFVRGPSHAGMQAALGAALGKTHAFSSVRLSIDIDPISTF